MYAYYFINKGPKTSLISLYSACLLIVPDLNKPECLKTPQKYRPNHYIYTFILTNPQIDLEGEYLIAQLKKRFNSLVLSRSALDNCIIDEFKRVTKPTIWPELLTVAIANSKRNEFFECNDKSLKALEKSVEKQLIYLANLKILPVEFNWIKTMKAVKTLDPKPYWWHKEIAAYYNLVNNTEKKHEYN